MNTDISKNDRSYISGLFLDQRLDRDSLYENGSFHLAGIGSLIKRDNSRQHYQNSLPGGVARPILSCIKCRRTMWRRGFNKRCQQVFECIHCGFTYVAPLRVVNGKIIPSRNQGLKDRPYSKPRSQMSLLELREYNRNKKAVWRERKKYLHDETI